MNREVKVQVKAEVDNCVDDRVERSKRPNGQTTRKGTRGRLNNGNGVPPLPQPLALPSLSLSLSLLPKVTDPIMHKALLRRVTSIPIPESRTKVFYSQTKPVALS